MYVYMYVCMCVCFRLATLHMQSPRETEDNMGPSPDSNSIFYFSYGSNMSTERIHINCPSARFVGAGVLHGYRLAFTMWGTRWRGSAADIIKDEENEVWGCKTEAIEIVL